MSATEIASPLPVWSLRRLRFVVCVAALAALVILGLMFMPSNRLDLGLRRSLSAVTLLIASILTFCWFVFFSPAVRSARLAVLALGLVSVGAVAGSIRRLEFTGDMTPLVDWRWQTDRDQILEAHRAAQGSGKGKTAISEITTGPHDVLDYRGSRRDGIVEGPPLAASWIDREPKLVWRQPCGGGYAALVLAGPLAITIEQRRDKEAIVAYDADSGAERWVYDYPALFHENLGGDGPRATPTIADGRVFALGATGVLSCLDLITGALRWSKNILSINECDNLDWGMSGSPLVFDNLVIVNPGTQKGSDNSRSLLAFHAENGELAWGMGQGQASYASPMLENLAGRQQILIFDALGLAGFDVARNAQLWRLPWKSDFNLNAIQPIVAGGDRVLISSNAGSALVLVKQQNDTYTAGLIWKNRQMKCNYACPIARGDYVYGLDAGILVCLEMATGKRAWKGGRYGHGQMLLAGELLVILGEAGELALVRATPDHFAELGRIQAIEGRTWNNPTMRDGRIFVRNHLEMAAYDLPLAAVKSP